MSHDHPRTGSDWIAPDCAGMDFYAADQGFRDLLAIYLPRDVLDHLTPHYQRLGQLAGGRLDELARIADRHPPVLHPRDRFGRDQDWIEYHPAYREMEQIAFGDFQFHAMSHRGGVLGLDRPLPPVAKYAFQYLFVQGEFGLMCPISVTDTSIHLIRTFGSNSLQDYLLPKMLSADLSSLWKGTQFMTEKAGGSDVGAIETIARQQDGAWRLHGEKWFCSHTDADIALMLARPEGAPAGTRGLALFALPRRTRDGSRNAYRIVRLKDKLGTKSMASGEIRLEGRRGLPGRPAGPGPEADDGAGEPVPPVARRARRRDDAPLRERGFGGGAWPDGVRPDGRRFPADAPATDEDAGARRTGAVDGAVHRRRAGPRGVGRNCAS